MKLTYTVEEVAEVLGVSKSSVYNLRNAGTIHQLTKLPGVLFSVKEIQAIAGLETEVNSINYRALKAENEELAKENAKLKNSIKKSPAIYWRLRGNLSMTSIMKIAGFVLLLGTPGSLEIDVLTFYEAMLQGLLGITLLYSGIYIDKLKKAQ